MDGRIYKMGIGAADKLIVSCIESFADDLIIQYDGAADQWVIRRTSWSKTEAGREPLDVIEVARLPAWQEPL